MTITRSLSFSFVAALAFCSVPAWALEVPAIFGDHMVIQSDVPATVWGWSDPGSEVTVSIAGQTATTKAGDDGAWKVTLKPIDAGRKTTLEISDGKEGVSFTDVLAGEVWLASGQSNMAWTVAQTRLEGEFAAGANLPELRMFTVAKAAEAEPLRDVVGEWVVSTPESFAAFSAVGYHFGRELHEALDRPVGVVVTSWGGSAAEAWVRRETLEADASLAPLVEMTDRFAAGFDTALAAQQATLKAWEDAGSTPPRPRPDPTTAKQRWAYVLYNGMVAPLAPITTRGVIWYQGEANAVRAEQYRHLFPLLIEDWREVFDREDLPFLFVQLANFRKRLDEPADSAWAELREAQAMTLAVPHTGMAVAIDVGEAGNIHPANKAAVGHRLALRAFAQVYGRDVVDSGPMFRKAEFKNGRATLTFDDLGGGLSTSDGQAPRGFAIAGEDRKFYWAEATIEGDAVVVHSPSVAGPVAVRYAWADNPDATLTNAEGLPASPFRTDEWPGLTTGVTLPAYAVPAESAPTPEAAVPAN